ncbi:hypothetical protein SAY86_021932 [Trapa natans]|uniref:Uncharacterized protein n=1 Tax=Trapa natans TaxID=22666 RepID=A0AAN7MT74_TRANT|nr:hypothetical protein SAY86_021932 [Trapa natans]
MYNTTARVTMQFKMTAVLGELGGRDEFFLVEARLFISAIWSCWAAVTTSYKNLESAIKERHLRIWLKVGISGQPRKSYLPKFPRISALQLSAGKPAHPHTSSQPSLMIEEEYLIDLSFS